MNKKLKEKINEAFSSVLPISLIVLALATFLVSVPVGAIMMFFIGTVMLIVGMGFFSLGSDIAMLPIGEGIGVQFTKMKSLVLIILLSASMGVMITLAEPGLKVLSQQIPSIPSNILIGAIAAGVGIFLTIAILRILFQISLPKMLMALYAVVFAISIFTPGEFVPVAFDAGGVTTGPITVPFIMALGLGVSYVRSDKNSNADSFGLVGLCYIGPIIMVMLLGIAFSPMDATYSRVVIPDIYTTREAFEMFGYELPAFSKEVIFALLPIAVFFALFQLLVKRYKKRQLLKIASGYVYTIIGLILFLTGVSVGFMPVGHLVGYELAVSANKWILVPVGVLIGFFIVMAEPSVHVLNKQVEEASGGLIPGKVMMRCLSIGVACSVGFAMIRVITGISIYWFLVPGYIIALAGTFLAPKMFTGIAFDSGGVASGPMTSTFLLPFTIGACEGLGGNVLADAFGVVTVLTMTTVIAVQILGVVYREKPAPAAKTDDLSSVVTAASESFDEDDEVFEFEDIENFGSDENSGEDDEDNEDSQDNRIDDDEIVEF